MIGKNEIELMKKDAFLINTSRGAVLNETALVAALKNKKIGGAGLDVFEEEPLPDNSPLRKLKNVILTPHTAGEPDGLYFHSKRFKFFAENIRRVSRGKPPKNVLNQLDSEDTLWSVSTKPFSKKQEMAPSLFVQKINPNRMNA